MSEGASRARAAGARARFVAGVSTWGTISLFVRAIPLPSSAIALVRGIVGTLFLLAVMLVRREPIGWAALWRNRWLLLLSGAAIGANWILLFEAYRFTTVSTATLCYYLAPIIVIALSPILFRERLTVRKLACIGAALAGMALVSGALTGSEGLGSDPLLGIGCGLGAALGYATGMSCNKRIVGVGAYEKTVAQLAIVVAVLAPYVLLTEDVLAFRLDAAQLILLLVVGVVHTGIAYYLYFGSMEHLPAQSIAVLCYIDPVVAVLISILVLGEPMSASSVLGAALILGAAIASELPARSRS